jgi:hypothetical protein
LSFLPYKFIIVSVLQQTEDGKTIAEAETEPVTIFGIDGLLAWAQDFERKLEDLQP